MSYRYYIQKEPLGVRRYSEEGGERWDSAEKKWTENCAPEAACIATKDKRVSESEALALIKERLK